MKKSPVLTIFSYFFITTLIFSSCFLFYNFSKAYVTEDGVNQEVKELNNEIQDKQSELKDLQDKQKKYSEAIKQKQQEKASLNNQLAIIDNRIAKAELDIELVETDIDTVKLEIMKTDIEIEERSSEIEDQKSHISNVVKLMHKRDNISSLEILLLNDSLADFLSQFKYLEDISEDIQNSLDELRNMKRNLEKQKTALGKKNEELSELKNELKDKKDKLDEEKGTKVYVIDQVGASEREYQRLLAQAKQEQEAAAAEIASMEKLVRAKLASLDEEKLEFNDNGMIWPVVKNVITAYFHDPDYPFRNIFEHPAVDIRASHGSTLKAAASGYVARVKYDGTTNYAYIMLVHGDGISTVYGHVSKVYVQEDEYVIQGQKIGLTGGMPGTPGAGRLTTGPHLHFEVRLNGIPVDPLSYLP